MFSSEQLFHDYFPFREADGVVRLHQVLRRRTEKPSQEKTDGWFTVIQQRAPSP